RNEVLETGKQARRRGLFGRRFLGHAERSPTRGREGRTEGSGPCRFLMSREATRGEAITMTPACMGRSGIHFTRDHTGSKKALQGSGPRFFWQAKEAAFPWCRKVGAHSAMTTIATCHVRMVNGCAAASGEETNRFLRSNRPVW